MLESSILLVVCKESLVETEGHCAASNASARKFLKTLEYPLTQNATLKMVREFDSSRSLYVCPRFRDLSRHQITLGLKFGVSVNNGYKL